MKKAFAILFLSIILAVGIFLTSQFVFSKSNNVGQLQITSQPEAKVYLDNQYIGTTPICRCAGSHGGNVLAAGDYTISLQPMQNNASPFIENITITKGVLTVVDHTFGNNGLASGSTLQLIPADTGNNSGIVVTSFPSGANVSLDNNLIGTTPVSYANPTESDHAITLSKNGYMDKTLHIRTPQGYILQAIVYLALNVQTPQASPSGTTDEASVSASLSPSPVVAKVTILSTPTGYLNVRSLPSISSAEIEQVKPGDSLYLLNEQDGWYQVKLPDNKIGWVSNQYAQKNQ